MPVEAWIARVPLGLEKTCAAEIRALGGGVGKTRLEPGLIHFEGPADAGYRANLQLRCAERVLKPLWADEALGFHTLRVRCSEIPWEQYLPSGCSPRFSVSAVGCKLYHTGAVEDALREGLESRGVRFSDSEEAPELSIDARGTRDRWTLSIDTSGRGLSRRGYRKRTAKAPLRETLAATVLRLAGYVGERPLLDPMCGSGTFVIEGALIAASQFPGLKRSFAFESFPSLDAARWAELKEAGEARVRSEGLPALRGSDSRGGALRAARPNAARAGVGESTSFEQRPVEELPDLEGAGLLVLNPPYGRRLDSPLEVLAERWGAWGARLRAAAPGWDIALVSPSPELARAFGATARPRARFRNGGIPVGLWVLPAA